MEMLVEQGQGVQESEGFRLTPQGLRFADVAGAEFLR